MSQTTPMESFSGARSNASNSVRAAGSGLSKYDQLRADLQDEIAKGLAEVEKEGDKNQGKTG